MIFMISEVVYKHRKNLPPLPACKNNKDIVKHFVVHNLHALSCTKTTGHVTSEIFYAFNVVMSTSGQAD